MACVLQLVLRAAVWVLVSYSFYQCVVAQSSSASDHVSSSTILHCRGVSASPIMVHLISLYEFARSGARMQYVGGLFSSASVSSSPRVHHESVQSMPMKKGFVIVHSVSF